MRSLWCAVPHLRPGSDPADERGGFESVPGDHEDGVPGPHGVERELFLTELVAAAHTRVFAEAITLRGVQPQQVHVVADHFRARALVDGADGAEVIPGLHDDGDKLGLHGYLDFDIPHDLLGGAGAQPEKSDQEQSDDGAEADHRALEGVGGCGFGGGGGIGVVQNGLRWPGCVEWPRNTIPHFWEKVQRIAYFEEKIEEKVDQNAQRTRLPSKVGSVRTSWPVAGSNPAEADQFWRGTVSVSMGPEFATGTVTI